jgi:hypothetical protein
MGSVVAQDIPTPPDAESLGPVSPELVLVDPVLAEVARRALPVPSAPRRVVSPPPRKAPRRLRRTVALAAIIFTAGAASGQFVGEHGSSSRQGLDVVREKPDPPVAEKKPDPPVAEKPVRRAKDVRPPATRRAWAANVLGVSADVSPKAVNLVWKRPVRSDHVVVVRERGPGARSVVVFRGRAAGYRDSTARSCSEYRYTIVNYDRRGRRSTGVLTSVVTPGCA